MSTERSAGAMDDGRTGAVDAGQLSLRFDAGTGAAGNERRSGLAMPREKEPGDAAAWRALEPELGDVAFICPGCWPELARQVGAGVTVRVLGQRPDWARCGMCDPEPMC